MKHRNATAEIEDIVNRYIGLSDGMRFAEKRQFWDADEDTPLLAPEEVGAPLVGWQAIEKYWGATRATLQSLRTECWDIVVNPMSETEAIALFKQRWVARMTAPEYLAAAPLASTVRVSMGLRRRAATWKIFMSVESHVDGVEYFRDVVARRAVTLSTP
ncbi:MAG: hypothetical protein AMXMBFR37_09800 [Steroidobacteraceae bacterium]